MKQNLSATQIVHRLPFFNLSSRPFRTGALLLLVTLMAFVLFGGSVLTISLQRGLSSVEARFGADLIAVPLGYDTGMESILLKGEPSYFYLEQSCLEQISEIEGVQQASAQFYLTSTSSDCCDIPVQLIGFDPDTDFSIQPWIRESYDGTLPSGSILVGSDIEIGDQRALTFFDVTYPVAAQLEKTGTGLDNAVYADMDTLRSMMRAAEKKGFHFLDDADPDNLISSVLVKIESGYDVDTVARNIRSQIDGLQLVKTQSMISGLADSLGSFSQLLYVFEVVFLAVALVMLALVFSITANERKKEFAILRILGATRKRLSGFLLSEALLLSVGGGILGTGLAALIVFPFSVAISERLGLPYLMPSVSQLVLLLLISLAVTFASGPIAAAYSAWHISRADASVTLREGE
jgi:putative ABC transport system permease protein